MVVLEGAAVSCERGTPSKAHSTRNTGTGVFPAVKLLTRVDTFTGGAELRVHQGPTAAHQVMPYAYVSEVRTAYGLPTVGAPLLRFFRLLKW